MTNETFTGDQFIDSKVWLALCKWPELFEDGNRGIILSALVCVKEASREGIKSDFVIIGLFKLG